MYKDAGYGENWQPRANNNARRINPYTRSCALLGCFFVVGFVLIVVVVLSLIPLYISHSSPTQFYVQVPKVYVSGYTLTFLEPWKNFPTGTILSVTKNLQTLQAALTSMIQSDSTLAGSIVEISKSSASSKRRRRDLSNQRSLSLDLQVLFHKACSSSQCLTQFQTNVVRQFSDKNRSPTARYEQLLNDNDTSSTSSQIVWLTYQLPNLVTSNASLAMADLKVISSSLENLINIDKNLNKPPDDNLITSTGAVIG